MKTINRLASFIKADHRYVYLGTSVIAALGLAFSQRNPTPLSFLAPTGVFQDCLWAILWAWIVVSAAALVTKLMHWSDYRETSPFASERFHRVARLGSYVVAAIAAIFFVDRCVMSFIDLVQVSIVSDSNPSDFLSSLVYMTYKSGDFFIRYRDHHRACHLRYRHRIFLALLFVFLRIQTFDRVDNDLTLL
ncbi:MAG: hypothetical protein ACLTYW_11510 [Collinsella sp.]